MSPVLRRVLEACARQPIGREAFNRIAAGGYTTPAKLGAKWVRHGWLERVGDGFEATAKAIRYLDSLAEPYAADGHMRPQLARIYHYLETHRVIDIATARKVLSPDFAPESVRPAVTRWHRAGFLRRTHRDTYRMPA